jgi:hypothetical protein
MKSQHKKESSDVFNMSRFYRHQYKPKVREKLSDMVVLLLTQGYLLLFFNI